MAGPQMKRVWHISKDACPLGSSSLKTPGALLRHGPTTWSEPHLDDVMFSLGSGSSQPPLHIFKDACPLNNSSLKTSGKLPHHMS